MEKGLQIVSAKILQRLLTVSAAVLLVLLLLRAVLTVDPYFDTFAYHLPFAARLAGFCSESCYHLGGFLEAAYDGYPKLMHRLQALVWQVSGRAHVMDLLNIGALALYCVFLRRWYRVSLAWTLCGLLAVPLIQIHATATYIDLPVNLAASAAILALFTFAQAPEKFGWSKLALLSGCLVFTAHSKPQMIAVVAVLGLGFAVAALMLLARGRQVGPFSPGRLGGWMGLASLLVALGFITAAKSIDNLIDHANPVYPVRLELPGITLEGPASAGAGDDSLAEEWRSVPSPLRWVASVLELGAYEYRQVPWTYDQGYCKTSLTWKDCWRPVTASFRMGGYFVPYVLGLLGFMAWWLRSQSGPARVRFVSALVGVTVLVSVLPRSHELRFYMFWMIVLVTLCLIAVFDTGCSRLASCSDRARTLLGTVILIALSSVLLISKGQYVDPAGPDLQAVIDSVEVKRQVAALSDGDTVCVDPAWAPHVFLFAPIFHAGRTFTVVNDIVGPCNKRISAPPAAP